MNLILSESQNNNCYRTRLFIYLLKKGRLYPLGTIYIGIETTAMRHCSWRERLSSTQIQQEEWKFIDKEKGEGHWIKNH